MRREHNPSRAKSKRSPAAHLVAVVEARVHFPRELVGSRVLVAGVVVTEPFAQDRRVRIGVLPTCARPSAQRRPTSAFGTGRPSGTRSGRTANSATIGSTKPSSPMIHVRTDREVIRPPPDASSVLGTCTPPAKPPLTRVGTKCTADALPGCARASVLVQVATVGRVEPVQVVQQDGRDVRRQVPRRKRTGGPVLQRSEEGADLGRVLFSVAQWRWRGGCQRLRPAGGQLAARRRGAHRADAAVAVKEVAQLRQVQVFRLLAELRQRRHRPQLRHVVRERRIVEVAAPPQQTVRWPDRGQRWAAPRKALSRHALCRRRQQARDGRVRVGAVQVAPLHQHHIVQRGARLASFNAEVDQRLRARASQHAGGGRLVQRLLRHCGAAEGHVPLPTSSYGPGRTCSAWSGGCSLPARL